MRESSEALSDCLRYRVGSILIRRLFTAEEILASQRLRYQVWQREGVNIKNGERGLISDAHEEHAFHWGAFDGEKLVGSARLCFHGNLQDAPDGEMFECLGLPLPVASLNRLVVLPEYRTHNIGARLDCARIEFARMQAAKTVIVAPIDRPDRKRSLERQGFVLTDKRGIVKWSDFPIVAMFRLLHQADSQ